MSDPSPSPVEAEKQPKGAATSLWEAALNESRTPVECPRCGKVGETNERFLTVGEALALHRTVCKNPAQRLGFLRRLFGGRHV